MRTKFFTLSIVFSSLLGYNQTSLPVYVDFASMTLPTGWQVSHSWDWYFANTNENFPTASNGYIWTSYGSVPSEIYLQSPTIHRNGNLPVIISYYQHLKVGNYSSLYTKLLVSVNNGITWQIADSLGLQANDSTFDVVGQKVVDITTNLGSATDFKVRLSTSLIDPLQGACKWSIDDISISEVYNNDVGIVDLLSPNLSACGLNQENISVTIKNFGLLAVSEIVPIEYSLDNGNTWITEQANINVAPGTTTNYTFNTLANFSVPQTYNLLVRTNWQNDEQNFNDQKSFTILSLPKISIYPYFENFEASNGYWYTSLDTSISSWQWGHPNSPELVGGANGSANAWKTNLTGNHLENENSWVESPCFDFSGLSHPILEMDIWYQTNASVFSQSSGVKLEASFDNGATWFVIGNVGEGQNWYTNNTGWFGSSNIWLHAKHNLDTLAGHSNVKLRIKAKFITYLPYYPTEGGFAFDNVKIYEQPLIDVGISELFAPENKCGLTHNELVRVRVKNYGVNTVNGPIPLAYSIDGGQTFVQENMSVSLSSGQEMQYTFFAHPANMQQTGVYNLVVKTLLPNDEDTTNNALVRTVVNKPIVSNYPFVCTFEDSTAQYWTIGQNLGSPNQWVLGYPNKTSVVGTTSGNNAWTVGLTGNYLPNQYSYVESPCFDLSNIQYPMLKMNVNYNLLPGDYVKLEYSTDGVAWFGVPQQEYVFIDSNWYVSSFGWTGLSNQYVTAFKSLMFLNNPSSVRFRVIFTSNSYGTAEGFAFDDFEIFNNPQLANETQKLGETLSVYPNPSNGVFVVEYNNLNSVEKISVYDLLGNELIMPIIKTESKIIVNMTSAKKGYYLLKVQTSNGKIVHQRVVLY